MKYYCDTSVLASLYLEDSNSKKTTRWLQEVELPLPLSPLSELELVGAVQQRLFRKQITMQEAVRCQYDIQDDIKQGIYSRVTLEQREYERALQLIHCHTSSIGCRTLDVLHIASALLLNIREFVTCDARQKLLAQTAGLKVIKF